MGFHKILHPLYLYLYYLRHPSNTALRETKTIVRRSQIVTHNTNCHFLLLICIYLNVVLFFPTTLVVGEKFIRWPWITCTGKDYDGELDDYLCRVLNALDVDELDCLGEVTAAWEYSTNKSPCFDKEPEHLLICQLAVGAVHQIAKDQMHL